jgi:hypothetical protein
MEARPARHIALEASTNGDGEASTNGDGESSSLSPDPLRRLEAELGQTDRDRPDAAGLYEETQRLLEETWSIFTEILVMRDGLLEACQEIERTMNGIHHQLGALPVAIEPNGQEHLANGKRTAASSSNGAGAH